MEKLKNLRNTFDKITSNNCESWSLVLFWIVIFEIIATMIEYSFIHHTPEVLIHLPDGVYTEIVISALVTFYVWMCIYSLVFWHRSAILFLILFGFIGLYLIVTHDFIFDLFIENFNILHLVQRDTGINLIIQLFFKIIIFYLIFLLVKSLKIKKN